MTKDEHVVYDIRCLCGISGEANIYKNDSTRKGDRAVTIRVSSNFEWLEEMPEGPGSFFSRRLTCRSCGRTPTAFKCL